MTQQIISDVNRQIQSLNKQIDILKIQELKRQINLISTIIQQRRIFKLIRGYEDQQKIRHRKKNEAIISINPDSNYQKQIQDLCKEQVKKYNNEYKKRPWQFQIIKNRDSEIDVCTFDFVGRDSKYLGAESMHINHNLLIKQARILIRQSQKQNNEQEKFQICFPSKYADTVFHIFQSKYILLKDYYNNVISIGIQLMISDFINLINKNFTSFYEGLLFSEDQDNFCRLNDNILQDFQNLCAYIKKNNNELYQKQKPRINEAKQLINNIKKRKLYKFVKELKYSKRQWRDAAKFENEYNKTRIIQKICSYVNKQQLSKDEICISIDNIGFGSGNKNIFQKVRFFAKEGQKPYSKRPKDQNKNLSMLYSDAYNQCSIKIYIKQLKHQKITKIQLCLKRFIQQIQESYDIKFSEAFFAKTPYQPRQDKVSVDHKSSPLSLNENNQK